MNAITVTDALTLTKIVSEISKSISGMKSLKGHDAKRQIDEITDKLHELKRQAYELEDQNRKLREKLRFKSDDYEFRNPFWYEKTHPDHPLCPKCFAKENIGHMGKVWESAPNYRWCLVCDDKVQVREDDPQSTAAISDDSPLADFR
jgi:hypothetical protein